MKETLLTEPIRLIGPGAGVSSDDADEETHSPVVPPLRRFPPPADDLLYAVEALPTDEGTCKGYFYPAKDVRNATRERAIISQNDVGLFVNGIPGTLYRAGKLCALLAQFPPNFENDNCG